MAQRTLELAGLALAILLLLRFTPPAMRAWRVYAGVRTRRLADAGPMAIAPSGPVAAILDQLRAIGFSRIGERSLVMPTGTTAFEWLWADETGSTYVAVVPSRVVMIRSRGAAASGKPSTTNQLASGATAWTFAWDLKSLIASNAFFVRFGLNRS